jgi:restriction system protein
MVMWKINAGRGSKLAQDFIDQNIVAIGWREVTNPTDAKSKEDVILRVVQAYPHQTRRQSEVAGNQIWRFLKEIKEGDDVITYDPVDRVYHLGKITGKPKYKPDGIDGLPNIRSVDWQGTVLRDNLSKTAKNKLGAILTLFQVTDVAARELLSLREGGAAQVGVLASDHDELAAAEDPFDTIEEQALERIKDRLLSLGWEDMQEVVAALLRALGYRTIVSPAGPDRGKDIIASRDGFGFEQPRIVVEVKHRKGQMGAPEIRAFLGGRHAEDRGLYVSTGGFSREAYFEAERAATVTHLMTLDGLARALIENYETVDERGRTLLPLTKLYWPS